MTLWWCHIPDVAACDQSRDRQLTSCPVSSTQSLEHCFLASISTLNMVQTDSGTLKSVDLLAFCILESNADFVLWDKKKQKTVFVVLKGLPVVAVRHKNKDKDRARWIQTDVEGSDPAVVTSQSDLLTQASIMSLAISLSLCSRCLANSGSGQWRSSTNICRASSFQNKSSEVAEPLLQGGWRAWTTDNNTQTLQHEL